MAQTISQDTIKALAEGELTQVAAWAAEEIATRQEHKKQETIAKIKELAGAVGVTVAIGGGRGRPVKARPEGKAGKNGR